MPYEHLRVVREEPSNDRKKKPGFGRPAPADPQGHGQALRQSFASASEASGEQRGFDHRHLLKVRVVDGFQPDDLAKIPGLDVVSQEDDTVILAFGSDQAMAVVEQRLTLLAQFGRATRAAILFAIEGFDAWTATDRTGAALAQLGLPDERASIVDVELWPIERRDQREQLRQAFDALLAETGIEKLDDLDRASLLLYRLRVSAEQLDTLLIYRDVRLVDLPPRYALETSVLRPDINAFPPVQQPDSDAAFVAVLDSGVATAHPVIGAATAEAAGFVRPERNTLDATGHGTRVAGLALYDDVADRIEAGEFIPELRLLSGKVFSDDGQDDYRFVEKSVEEAVRYFLAQYGCKVFCLSYGDLNKTYDGRHVRGLAYTIDALARELGVLFVVPTGNLAIDMLPDDPLLAYPAYLLHEASRLLDPAPALNALTVGGLAEYELDENAQRHPEHIESVPVARRNQPSPITRCGPSVSGAIKPDLVDYAGNIAVRRMQGRLPFTARLGVLSTSKDFSEGIAFNDGVGTSFAAPRVAHLAAKVLRHYPDMRSDTLRAVLAVHARWPGEATTLLANQDALLRLCGYGQVDRRFLLRSDDAAVTLVAEDAISFDRHHFYELPLPADLWTPGRRTREISIALAHSPFVRTTRIDYRATKLSFKLVAAISLEQVTAWYNRARAQEAVKVPEVASSSRLITGQERENSTLQRGIWNFRMPKDAATYKLFMVITRQDSSWNPHIDATEPYSLAVTIKDLENPAAQLYAQVRDKLRLRDRARARGRG